MITPDQAAAKWQRNLAASGDSMRAGIQAVTQSPTEAAAAKQSDYLAGVQRAADSGKWARNLRAVSLDDWKTAMTTKALPRIATGAASGAKKQAAFMAQWLPYQQQLSDKVKNMPKGTPEAALERVRVAIAHNSAFRRSSS